MNQSKATPRIVVLDGLTLNPGDLSWMELEALGACAIHERTTPTELVARAANAEILLTNKTVLTAEHLAALPRLKYIGVMATGTNVVDVAAARERNVVVTNVPAYSTASVVQLTFALLLELTHHAGPHNASVHDGKWSRHKDFCYWDYPLVELEGLTLGIVGLGRIGMAVARVGVAFGMKVIATTRTKANPPPFIELISLEDVFRRSDVLSLHCPLTMDTGKMVNASRLALMKPSAFLLNTSRGALIDEPALAEALNSGRLAGAGLDVLSTEPPSPDNPLLGARNCVITPHLAWASFAARRRLLKTVVQNIRDFEANSPKNVVN